MDDHHSTQLEPSASEEQLALRLGELLQQRGWCIATAESCTGGLIGAAITAVAGSSGWFEQGFITYSNAAKTTVLDVPAALVDAHGAVSEEVVAAMATGARGRAAAEVGVAVSGVAGPGGGTVAKPVGTVCIGWASAGAPVRTLRLQLSGNREAVRRATVREALRGTIDLIEKTREAVE